MFSSLAISAERISLYPDVGSIRVTGQGSYIKDDIGDLKIEQILQKPEEVWNSIPSTGFKKPFDAKPYWIKIPVRCTSSGIFYLQSSYVILEEFALYVHNSALDTVLFHGDLGLKSSIEESKILHSSIVFRMLLDADNDYTFYIRLNKRFSTTAFPFYIRDSRSFVTHVSSIEKERGVIYGIFLILVVQGFVLWSFFRESIYFSYTGYVIMSFLILFISDGTFRLFFPSKYFDVVHFSIYFILPTCFSFVFLVLFDLLKTRAYFPRIVKFSWWIIGLSYSFSIINAAAYFYAPSYPLILFRLSTAFVLIYPVVFILVCIKTYLRNKSKPALVLLGLFSLTLMFILFFAFLPFLTYNHESFSAFKWIILFEGVVLMLIINRDLYLSKVAKNRLLEDLITQKDLSSQRYLQGLLDERKRMAEELHDNLSAKLSAMKIQLSGFDFSDASKKRQALHDLDELHRDVRNISHAISPILLKSKGLKNMLEEFILKIEDSDLDLTVDYQLDLNDAIIPSPHEEILYFTVFELINNVLKHAQSNYLKLELIENGLNYTIIVEDNGTGYNPTVVKSGLGIASIEQRAAFLNGSFHVEALAPGTRSVFVIQKS